MKRNQNGFSLVEVLLIIIAVGIISVVGLLVFNNAKNSDTPVAKSTTERAGNQADSTQSAVISKSFINVIQDEETVFQSSPDKLAKTSDQAAILVALHESCDDSNDYVTVSGTLFVDDNSFKQEGSHASISAGRCTPIAKSINEVDGSGSRHLVRKNTSGVWVIDASGQMNPDCSQIDGKGYPVSIIDECYEGSEPRAPRQ